MPCGIVAAERLRLNRGLRKWSAPRNCPWPQPAGSALHSLPDELAGDSDHFGGFGTGFFFVLVVARGFHRVPAGTTLACLVCLDTTLPPLPHPTHR